MPVETTLLSLENPVFHTYLLAALIMLPPTPCTGCSETERPEERSPGR